MSFLSCWRSCAVAPNSTSGDFVALPRNLKAAFFVTPDILDSSPDVRLRLRFLRGLLFGVLALLISLAGDGRALLAQQVTGAEMRRPFITCGALFAALGDLAAEKKDKDDLAGITMLFALWASQVEDPNVPKDQRTKVAVGELAEEIERMAPQVKQAKDKPGGSREFRARVNDEFEVCKALLSNMTRRNQEKR